MGRILSLILVVVIGFWFLASCLSNPFGVTDRATIKHQKEQNIAQIQADAQVDIASWDAQARMKEAEEAAKALTAVAKQQRISSQTWANTLPTLALILVCGVVLALVVIYRGKALVLFAQKGVLIPLFPELQRPHPPPVMVDRESALEQYARDNNQHVRKENGYYLLIDNATNQVVKQLALK